MDDSLRQFFAAGAFFAGPYLAGVGASASLAMAPAIGGPDEHVAFTVNPATLAFDLGWHIIGKQDLTFSGEAWTMAGALAAGTVATVGVSMWGWKSLLDNKPWRRLFNSMRRNETKEEKARYRHLAWSHQDLVELRPDAAASTARRLGIVYPNAAAMARMGLPQLDGVLIGHPLDCPEWKAKPLIAGFEDLHVDIWGPRQGKTTSRVIPAILAAIGSVLTTSNRSDVVAATREIRAELGPTWVFDLTEGRRTPRFYWDPLTYIVPADQRPALPVLPSGGDELDNEALDELLDKLLAEPPEPVPGAEQRAQQLAAHFAAHDRDANTSEDAYFDPTGEDLLAGLLLAAALAGRPIDQVWEWLNNPANAEPVQLLELAGHTATATGVLAIYHNSNADMRSSVFAVAIKLARVLRSPDLKPWITPSPDVPEFDHRAFVASDNQTLYLLSDDRTAYAGPIVNALTAAVLEAAMQRADASPGGRLPTPLLAVLDEAANVVTWELLPKMYSYFASRGIIAMTVLQSWSQGARVWGEDGMQALWSAASIRVVGSGLDEPDFLEQRSQTIGTHTASTTSRTKGGGSSSSTEQPVEKTTMPASDLRKLPKGTTVVFADNTKPVRAQGIPYWKHPEYKDRVEAAIKRFYAMPILAKSASTAALPAAEVSAAAAIPAAAPITIDA